MSNENKVKPSSRFTQLYIYLKILFKKFIKTLYIFSIAFMLGLSNAMNDENKMLNDIKPKIEQQDIIPDPDGEE